MVLPKRGRKLPRRRARVGGGYAEALAAALRTEFGDRRHTVKIIMSWTGASGRTVRYWLAGEAEPSAGFLIAMMARSDLVLETVLAASRRTELLSVFIDMRREPHRQRSTSTRAGRDGDPASDVPDRVPDVPDRVPDHRYSHSDEINRNMNERQIWFVASLKGNPHLSASDIAEHFIVSVRTAKRDIAVLKKAGLEFRGTRRRGKYAFAK